MKRIKIYELMDNPVPYVITRESDSYFSANFTVDDIDYNYTVYYGGGEWEIDFEVALETAGKHNIPASKITSIIGMDKPFTVLATVVALTKEFIKRYDPITFVFLALEPSRQKVYRVFAQMIQKEGYNFKEDYYEDSVLYKFTKRD